MVLVRLPVPSPPSCVGSSTWSPAKVLLRKKEWMFWGRFSVRYGKGHGVSWEKDWGLITVNSYQEHSYCCMWLESAISRL
ncbi:Uncharacterized protein HZ326_16301 [Fusarium oxysporum f. sp. albedinis]|nr:Uncharacterized protein HZ326_16301 [Fusarium oxysporum f. sp. albedinis]